MREGMIAFALVGEQNARHLSLKQLVQLRLAVNDILENL
jgi:hypothetical protein